jgi:hydroxymethylglutaryl-CoA reductase (NADPH)
MSARILRDCDDDYTHDMAKARRDFVKDNCDLSLENVGGYSFYPSVTAGNIENFIGVAQVAIGLAGPLLVNGEHAQGDFYIPMATSEGRLVASYKYHSRCP